MTSYSSLLCSARCRDCSLCTALVSTPPPHRSLISSRPCRWTPFGLSSPLFSKKSFRSNFFSDAAKSCILQLGSLIAPTQPPRSADSRGLMRRYGRCGGADNDKQQKQDGGWSLLTPRSFVQTTLMKNQPRWNRNGREKKKMRRAVHYDPCPKGCYTDRPQTQWII